MDTIELIDSHCHLDMKDYAVDLDNVIQQADRLGVKKIITIGIDLSSSQQAVRISNQYASVYAAAGVHPHDAVDVNKETLNSIAALADQSNVVGYGEIGLDYAKMYAPKEIQHDIFSRQLALAKDLHLPVIIHDREAHADTMDILKKNGPFPAGGVMHCFSGDLLLARQVIALGFHISIPGIVTFKNAISLQQVAKEIPLEHMIIETDGPFLAPVPYRGKRNTPAFLIHTATRIAELRDTTLLAVAQQTTANTTTLFNLPRH